MCINIILEMNPAIFGDIPGNVTFFNEKLLAKNMKCTVWISYGDED